MFDLVAICGAIGTPLIGVIGYYMRKISKLEEQMGLMMSEVRVEALVKDHFELAKEKIQDRLEPIAQRLERLESKIDLILTRGKYFNE